MNDPATLLPLTASRNPDGALLIGGCALPDLAERFGTPLYVYDAATLHAQAQAYHAALAAYPGPSRVTYAAKAWLCTATAQWAQAAHLGLDVVSAGELAIALAAGFVAGDIHLHGNNKNAATLVAALEAGVGCVVVDHAAELALLHDLAAARGQRQRIWLRVNPAVEAATHSHTRTGHAASKFGVALHDGSAEVLAGAALALPWVELTGLHCHIGSQLFDPGPLARAAGLLVDLAARLHQTVGWQPVALSVGGGWGAAYTVDQAAALPPLADYVVAVVEAVVAGCGRAALPLPQLVLEPGRSLVARGGVAVYRVGALKQAGETRYAFVDGGLADNPRPALYGAAYSALLANRRDEGDFQTVDIAGPYCESGDVLLRGAVLPRLRAGDLLAVPAAGAYQLSMAGNYNAALRPAVVWVERGRALLIQRRETLADLLRRDLIEV
ncbi:MAG: diaminopimelate decarboxylase [Caldilineales bacterium]